MAAPRLNHRLALEAQARQPDGMGGYQMAWAELGVLWAEMKPGTGRESYGEVGPESRLAWRITVRGAPAGDPRRPVPGQRFRQGARVFRIEAVAERDAFGLWLTCFCREEDDV